MKRVRSESAREEENVSSFVEATVALESNVRFGSIPGPGSEVSPFVQVLGHRDKVSAPDFLQQLPDNVRGAVGILLPNAVDGKNISIFCGATRVFLGLLSSTASRHNSAVRPDQITPLAREVSSASKGGQVQIFAAFSAREHIQSVATAIAKGVAAPFSAKGNLWQKAYLAQRAQVQVLFPVPQVPSSSLEALARSIQICMRLVDAPTNLLDTVTFTEICQRLGHRYNFEVEVISGEELREKGYGGLYGVGKAAEYPPALVICKRHPPEGIAPQSKIALVGKGIVYDTGGLAIKNPANLMASMKSDMGGAAAVFCGFLASVAVNAPHVLTCLLCLADNAIGPRSTRNDDILTLRSGLTVEVNNTDAEGRLVLSDGVFHASELLDHRPDVIIDMATLTGAQGIATGKRHAAVMTTDGDWEARMLKCGQASGDLVFPIPYCPEFYNVEFTSKIADYKNLMANRSNAGVSCGGQFVANSLSKSYSGAFVHVDLAGPAFDEDLATGYGVSLVAAITAPSAYH